MGRSGHGSGFLAWALALLLLLSVDVGTTRAEPPPNRDFTWFENRLSGDGAFCARECAFQVYGGRATTTSMTSMFALDNVATFAPEKFVPPWEWNYSRAGIVAGAFSRRLATIAGVIDLDGEAGVAKRFGIMSETEVWAALYVRWTWFPWNHLVRTTIATSTGLNFATGIPDAERERDGRRRGSKLLHFFSPEITMGIPAYPQWDLVARIHHRSGARLLFGENKLFNGVDGGAHFATLGLRYKF